MENKYKNFFPKKQKCKTGHGPNDCDFFGLVMCGLIDPAKYMLEKYTLEVPCQRDLQGDINLLGLRTLQYERPDVTKWLIDNDYVTPDKIREYEAGIKKGDIWNPSKKRWY